MGVYLFARMFDLPDVSIGLPGSSSMTYYRKAGHVPGNAKKGIF